MNKKVTILLLAFLATACAAIQTTVEPSPVVLLATVTETARPLSTYTPIPVSSPTPELAPAPIYPALVAQCPANPMVPLSELGVDPHTRLLVRPSILESVWDENEVGLFVVSGDDPTPRLVPRLFQSRMVNSSAYDVSPNGQWVVFNRKAIGQEKRTAWIRSIDGQQQWSLSNPEDDLRVGYWLDDTTVILFDAEGEFRKVINPFTMEEEILTNLPETEIFGIGAILFRDAGHTWLLYQAGDDYRLFDPSTQIDQQVLEWLSLAGDPFINKSIDITSGGRIIIRFGRSYGLDISPAMDIHEVLASQSYSQTMQPIYLPEEVLPVHLSLLSRNGTGMIVYKVNLEEPTEGIPKVYWLDHRYRVIKEFCFDPANVFADISPDGKLVAFTRHYLPSQAPVPKSIFILNLETGYIAQIDGYQFVGWAWADE